MKYEIVHGKIYLFKKKNKLTVSIEEQTLPIKYWIPKRDILILLRI